MSFVSTVGGACGADAPAIDLNSSHPDFVIVSDAQLLFMAQYRQVGPDLILTGPDGLRHLIRGYFSNQTRPALMAPNGLRLSAEIVDHLVGLPSSDEYPEPRPNLPSVAIGKLEKVIGSVTITRTNIAVAQPAVGDFVYQGDLIETGADGLIAIVFVDGTAFHLHASARMVLDEFIPGGKKSSALFRVLKGVFSFIAGKMATTGRLIIDTPVAQIRSTPPRPALAAWHSPFSPSA